MKYLVDSSVWLEPLLKQERAEIAEKFFKTISPQDLAVTDFAVSSVGILLTTYTKPPRPQLYIQFLQDLSKRGVSIVSLTLAEREELSVVMQDYKLDFDDAYQYVASKRRNCVLVSFDGDFKRTPEKSKRPEEVLAEQTTTGEVAE